MCKTIKQKVRFNASPDAVFALLADAKKHTDFSGEQATSEPMPGGKFTAYGGRFDGINVELVPGKRIVQAWRGKNFPEGIYSLATFNLYPTAKGTELVLTHRGVPADLIPNTEIGWRELYWDKMKAYLNLIP